MFFRDNGEVREGKIVSESGLDIGVEFTSPVDGGHNCFGAAKEGHGLWLKRDAIIDDKDIDTATMQSVASGTLPQDEGKSGDVELKTLLDKVARDFIANKMGAVTPDTPTPATESPTPAPTGYNPDAPFDCWAAIKVLSETDAYRFLLYGPPGTGKTTAGAMMGDDDKECYNITVHDESSPSELVGHFVPKGNEFVWHDGVAVKAWKEGATLVINEVNMASGPFLTCLFGILDDTRIARLHLHDGQIVKPAEGFKVICTMNGTVDELPEPLIDRFDVKLLIARPSEEAILSLPLELQYVARNAYSSEDVVCTFRQVQHFGTLRPHLGDTHAAKLAFDEIWNEMLNLIKIGRR